MLIGLRAAVWGGHGIVVARPQWVGWRWRSGAVGVKKLY